MTEIFPGASATELARDIASGAITASGCVDVCLQRIRQYGGELNAFVHLADEAARRAAEAVDAQVARGKVCGPLAGVPFAVKDISDVAGMPTAQGSRAFAGAPSAAADEPMIARLRAAGAIPLGKTNVPEFGLHSATYNESFGVTRNPWDPARTPGGSSGGTSSAVAAGMVPFGTGSDGGGSIRTPAAFTGLVGFKPTTALVPRPSGESQLSCLGFLTTTVADMARLLDVSGGAHPGDRLSVSMAGERFESAIETLNARDLKIVWSRNFGFAPVEPEVADLARGALDRLVRSAELHEVAAKVRLPNVYRDWVSDALNFLSLELQVAGIPLERLDKRSLSLIERFSRADPAEYLRVRNSYNAMEGALARLFERADLLASPATACAAFGADEEPPAVVDGQDATWTGAEPLSMFANIAGIPAISIPAGVTRAGLPVGLQIAAPRFQDRLLLRLARIAEQTDPWPRLAPAYR